MISEDVTHTFVGAWSFTVTLHCAVFVNIMILSKRSYLFDFSSTPARVRRNTGGLRDVQARCPGSTVAAPGARHLGSVRRVSSLTDVCFWHKGDITVVLIDVRFRG